jgi:hypothetical protein
MRGRRVDAPAALFVLLAFMSSRQRWDKPEKKDPPSPSE